MKVFLCENIHPEALTLLKTRAEIVDDWARVGVCDAIITRNLPLTREKLAEAKSLKVVAIHGTGTDGVDLRACDDLGVTAFRVPHENADSVAELIVALALALLRKIHIADRLLRAGAPLKNAPPELFGHELAGKTVGLVGVGDIARRAARILREGFRANVIGYSPSLTPERAEKLGIGCCVSVREVLERADIVSLGARLQLDTVGLIGEEELACMRPHAILINTARGGLVDEGALYRALREGRIAGAAGDVFCSEPPTLENPLLGLDNFLATPHIGANTEEALRRVGMHLVEDLLCCLDGGVPSHPCHGE